MATDADVEVEGQGVTQTLKDLFSGACGGIAQVLIGESPASLAFFSILALFFSHHPRE